MRTNFRELTKTIHDPETMQEGESICIRTYFGDADRRRIQGAASEYKQNANGETVITATFDRLYSLKRQLAITSWTLLDEDNKPLPLTPDIVANLPPDVAGFVDRCIDDEWNKLGTPPATKEEAQQREEEAKQEKEDRATFPRSPGGDAVGASEKAHVESDDSARAGVGRRGGAAAQA